MENLVPTTMTSLFPTPDLITGLTGPQKCSIYAAWQLVKKDYEIHARNVFARFFEKYPEYLLYFSNDGTNLRLHEHSLAVFQSLSLLIEKGFTDVTVYENHLCHLAKVHPKILGNDVKNVIDIILTYLLETLAKQRTNTLDTALTAFFDGVCLAFDRNKSSDDDVVEEKDKEENEHKGDVESEEEKL